MNETTTEQVATETAGQNERLVSCDDPYYDKSGKELNEFDVVKVFHFIGARRKRYYMYKWIRKNARGELCMQHLTGNTGDLVPLRAVCKRTLAAWIWIDAEIVQSN